jgi:hypothetical protein
MKRQGQALSMLSAFDTNEYYIWRRAFSSTHVTPAGTDRGDLNFGNHKACGRTLISESSEAKQGALRETSAVALRVRDSQTY